MLLGLRIKEAGSATEGGVSDLQVRAAATLGDLGLPLAEGGEAEQTRVEGTTALRLTAGMFRVVVGIHRDDRELELGTRLKPLHGVASTVDESLGHRRVHAIERE